MLPTVPPAQVQAELPAHVHVDQDAALRAARRGRRPILVVLAVEEDQRRESLALLARGESAPVRAAFEVWVPSLGDAQATALRQAPGSEEGLAVVRLDPAAKAVQGVVAGPEAVPLARAFRIFLEAAYRLGPAYEYTLGPGPWRENPDSGLMEAVPTPMLVAEIETWLGGAAAARPFVDYQAARQNEPFCARREPFRTWLYGLLRHGRSDLRLWAATRLLEAQASGGPAEADPWDLFLEDQARRMDASMRQPGIQPDRPRAPVGLGGVGFIPRRSPFWTALRGRLRAPGGMEISRGLYALLHGETQYLDRDWVLASLRASAKRIPGRAPWDSAAFWLGADWLVLHATAEDWTRFAEWLPPAWQRELGALRAELARQPAYEAGQGPLAALFTRALDETPEARRRAEDAALDASRDRLGPFGITKEGLAQPRAGGLDVAHPAPLPRVPEAERRGLGTRVIVDLLVDPAGTVRVARLRPAYGLALFAAAALEGAAAARYSPQRPEDAGKPCRHEVFLTFPAGRP